MECTFHITVPARQKDQLPQATQSARETVNKLNRLMSFHDPDSEVSAINRIGELVRLPVSETTHRLLRFAKDFSEKTDGLFNMSIAPLGYLWGFYGGHSPQTHPSPLTLKKALEYCATDNVRLEHGVVRLLSPNTRIDLGAVLKGFAVDNALIQLHRSGVSNVLVSLGSQARCLGRRSATQEWTVPIPHPRNKNELSGQLLLSPNTAVATSRLYENSILLEGIRYGDVIDPRTGWPAKGTLLATVVAPSATEADALATTLLIAGMEKGWKLLEQFPECEAIFVPEKEPQEIWVTKGLVDRFIPAPAFTNAIQILHRL